MIHVKTHGFYKYFVDDINNPNVFNIVPIDSPAPIGGFGDPNTILHFKGMNLSNIEHFGHATILKRRIQHLTQDVMRKIVELRRIKEQNPRLTNSYYPQSCGSLLNAYREGDLDFEECVELLKTANLP